MPHYLLECLCCGDLFPSLSSHTFYCDKCAKMHPLDGTADTDEGPEWADNPLVKGGQGRTDVSVDRAATVVALVFCVILAAALVYGLYAALDHSLGARK